MERRFFGWFAALLALALAALTVVTVLYALGGIWPHVGSILFLTTLYVQAAALFLLGAAVDAHHQHP